MTIELNGKLLQGNEWDEIYIGDESLTDFAEQIDGCVVKLKYYLSDKEINKETAAEMFLCSFYEGKAEVDNTYMSGSSWTGVYAKNDDFSVGGHDIISELSSHLGKYCYLIVKTTDL